MIRFEGKIKEETYGSPEDSVKIEGELNGKRCRIIIEAPGIAEDLEGLYGADSTSVPINIGNGEEL
jgi:hypothetical protein